MRQPCLRNSNSRAAGRWALLGSTIFLIGTLTACASSAPRTTIESTADPASSTWDAAVERQLVADFDRNASGSIDTAAELNEMPCDLWRALDTAVRDTTSAPLASAYGLRAGLTYRADQLGVARTLRAAARQQLEQCAKLAAAKPPGQSIDVSDAIVALPASGGSSDWDAQVKSILLKTFDLDESGVIDALEEIDSIHCDTWRAMDAGARATDDIPMAAFYGFSDGYTWVGNSFGFDELYRRNALSAMSGCGLQTD